MGRKNVANLTRILLFPVVIYFAIYWTCCDIFLWATLDEDSPFTRSFNLGEGKSSPIKDAMNFARDLVTPGSWR